MALDIQKLVLRSSAPRHLRHLLMVLAYHAHEDGSNIRPRVATLAKELGGPETPLHRTHVIRLLREVRELGYLEVVEHSAGRRMAVRYRLVLSALTGSASATRRGEQVASALPVGGEQVAPALPVTGSVRATQKSLTTKSQYGKEPLSEEELSGGRASPSAPRSFAQSPSKAKNQRKAREEV